MPITIVEPKVYLVGGQTCYSDELDGFLTSIDAKGWTTDTDQSGQELVEVAGRLCYQSFRKPRPGGNKAYVEHILEVGHGSVLEHAVFSLILTGVSRSFTHELVRHRVGFSYSQLSQRFVDEAECAFVVPPSLKNEVAKAIELIREGWNGNNVGDEANCLLRWSDEGEADIDPDAYAGLEWLRDNEQSLQTYESLIRYLMGRDTVTADPTLRRKRAREAARSVLPNCTETQIFVTGNARAFRHFIELRTSEHADAEIRQVGLLVLEKLRDEAPNIFGDYTLEDRDGTAVATTPHKKV